MSERVLPNQLVLYCDSASGFYRVGWATDVIEDRFEAIEVICKTDSSSPILPDTPYYEQYQTACVRVRELNAEILERQRQHYESLGWSMVPLDLAKSPQSLTRDDFGSFIEAARGTMYQLSGNDPAVWAVVQSNTVVLIRSCFPPKEMDELEYQVWKSIELQEMESLAGEIRSGELVALECGLWFHPEKTDCG